MTPPKVTILMPVYNAEPYLASAIESLLAQQGVTFELLIINDGSRDTSVKIIKSFQDPRIRLANHRQHRGIAVRLNEGLKLARGQYIARADADDLYYPERLKHQLRFLKKHRLSVVGTWAVLIDEQGKPFSWDRRFNDQILMRWSLLFGSSPLIHPSVMFDKRLVISRGGYDPTLKHVEDYELWSRLADQSQMGILEKELMRLRVHGRSVSRLHPTQQALNSVKVCQRNIEWFLGYSIGRKGYLRLKRWRLEQRFPSHHELLETLALLQTVYDRFMEDCRPAGRTLALVHYDYALKLLKLLGRNRAFDQKLTLSLKNLNRAVFKPLLYRAYRKNPRLFLSPELDFYLGKHLISDGIFFLGVGWRKLRYWLHCVSRILGLAYQRRAL